MDKNEFRLKIEQMMQFMKEQSYKEAYEIAESINWKKVRNLAVLCAASEVYEACGEYQKGREVLFLAYDLSPDSKKVIYRLGILALKQGELKEAMDCYEEFLIVAPKDSNRFILKYKILKAKQAPLEEMIAVLEEFKTVEYVEKWAFELALLYKEAGMITECLEECDDLILWFSEGKYIYKAMELKMQYKPLTPLQHEKYMSRFESSKEETPVQEVVEEVSEEAETEEVVEEPITEEVVEPVEEVEEVQEELPVEEKEELPVEEKEELPVEEKVQEPSSGASSIEEMVQAWEKEQQENAQMIQSKMEQVVQEKAKQEEQEESEEEKEEILPNDVRTLMEELEAESAEISAQKVAVEETVEEKPLFQKVVEQLSSLDKKFEKVEKEEPTEAEVIEEIEDDEEEGIKLGDTQSIALSAKALANTTRVELPVEAPVVETVVEKEPVQKPKATFDTGFIVQGRYDLEARSEVGIKAGLTEEQKKLFSYFVPVHGMSEQLVKVLEDDKNCKTRYGTSKVGNIVIVGRRGSGKTVLAVDIVKAIQKERRIKHGKVAIVKAEALNKKDAREIVVKLHGGALVIEKASRLQRSTVEILCSVMEGQTGELLVVLEDERKAIEKLFAEHPNFKQKFTSRIDVPVFLNDELVTFGQTYAKENGYKIDDMGILALYSDIDILQREEKVVTVADVKALIDDAIENAKRPTLKKVFKKLIGKSKDESNRIILKEEDFR